MFKTVSTMMMLAVRKLHHDIAKYLSASPDCSVTRHGAAMLTCLPRLTARLLTWWTSAKVTVMMLT